MRILIQVLISTSVSVLMTDMGYSPRTWQWWVAVLTVNAICIMIFER